MNKHLIIVKYVKPTNTRGSKIKLTSGRFEKDSITDGFPYSGGTLNPAIEMLGSLGYTIASYGEIPDGYCIAVNEFKPLKESLALFRAAKGKHAALTA